MLTEIDAMDVCFRLADSLRNNGFITPFAVNLGYNACFRFMCGFKLEKTKL